MMSMFEGARNFNSDLSKWDVRNAKRLDRMFRNASGFNADISRWEVAQCLSLDAF